MKQATERDASLDLYEVITNRVIEQLEKGDLAWRKTWSIYGLAENYVTDKPYSGINMLMIEYHDNATAYYATFFHELIHAICHAKRGKMNPWTFRYSYFVITPITMRCGQKQIGRCSFSQI